jgi:hypothetical protein
MQINANTKFFATGFALIVASIALHACSGGSKFSSKTSGGTARKTSAGNSPSEKNETGNGVLGAGSGDSSGVLSSNTRQNEDSTLTSFADVPPVAPVPNDFLLVVDNSVSMGPILSKAVDGFAKIPADKFSKDSRFAAMYTQAGSKNDLNRSHPYISPADGYDVDNEPGFLRLMTKASIDTFFASITNPIAKQRVIKNFNFEGGACESSTGWYSPTELNSKGKLCFAAGLQTALSPIGCEAGLVAVRQMVQKSSVLFRENAVANIVFVSDTHDPGCRFDNNKLELIQMRPTGQEISKEIKNKFKVLDTKIHAIAPSEKVPTTYTNEVVLDGFTYYEAAKQTGGSTLDIGVATDYSGFLKQVVQGQQEFSVKLTKIPKEIFSVKVDGEKISTYQVEGNVVKCQVSQTSSARKIEVHWK